MIGQRLLDPWFTATADEIAAAIMERDPSTRFRRSDGPLCRYPGLTPQQVKEEVLRDLAKVPARVG